MPELLFVYFIYLEFIYLCIYSLLRASSRTMDLCSCSENLATVI